MGKIIRMEDIASTFYGAYQGDKKHKKIIDGYNSIRPLPRGYMMKYTDAWCAAFVSYIAKLSGAKNFPYECSCYYMYQQAKKNKQVVKTPKVGYLVLYDWKNDTTINHVGIITAIEGSKLTVIEGNYSRMVRGRIIDLNNTEIECFIKVEYNTLKEQIKETVDTITTPKELVITDEINEIVNDVIRGKYGNGRERKEKITALGYDYAYIQKIVNLKMKSDKLVEKAKK